MPEQLQVGATSTCDLSYGVAGSVSISYDPIKQEIVYEATVPSGYYHSIGYGTRMAKTDMVAWFTNSTGPQQVDLYSRSQNDPTPVYPNTYTTSFTQSKGTTVFTTTRPLKAVKPDTYTIPLG